jgi:hypothetical protein
MAVEVDFADITIVSVDNPVGVVAFFDAVEGSNFGFDGDAFVDRGNADGFAKTVVFVEFEAFDVFFGFAEPQPNSSPEADVIAARVLLNDIFYGFEHFSIRFAAIKCKAVVGCEDVDGVLRLYHAHVNAFERVFSGFADCGNTFWAWVNNVRHIRKQIFDFD